ncbi:hypothetical protein [Vibrio sonorensis]|uniref:hypothetical protein n=1 Tax=Vibrio sonorensis TaxID=1004316 RepID=UPI0008DA6807|nr:hypothetical protein [Vibrio sonorensis]
MAVSVIICGLVRDANKLLNKLKNYTDWREQGLVDQIVFSTWIGEIDSYQGLRKQLVHSNIDIIEIEEPRLVLKGGHQLHQMLSLYYGLSKLNNKDQFVLRTRVDLADNHEAMLHDFVSGTPVAEDFAEVGLKHKILIEYSQMAYPFLCGDAQFFGHFEDLMKLINMSADMELLYNRLAVEQTFFFHPFKDCRLFKQHFYWNLPHISEIADRRSEQCEDIVNTAIISDVVQAWWLILDRYFKVGWGEYKNIDIELKSMSDAFLFDKDIKIIGGEQSDVIADHSFVSAINRVIDHETKNRLVELISDKEPLNMFKIDIDIFNSYESFSKKYSDLPSAKANCSISKKNVIRGAAQHFFVKNENDSASKRYHEQITALRRENDFLRKELNISITNSPIHRVLSRVLPRKAIEFFKYKLPFATEFYARNVMKKKGK